MVRKSLITILQLIAVCSVFFINYPIGSAAPQEILICSEVTLSNEPDLAKGRAIEEAKCKAVEKALASVVASADAGQDVFTAIRDKYQKYVLSVQLVKEQQVSGHISLVAKVVVDFDTLEADIRKVVRRENNKQRDDTVGFFIRGTGPSTDEFMILQRYHKTFSDIGFKTINVDEEIAAMQKYSGKTYPEYVKEMQKEIEEQPEITIAVIGEIEVIPNNVDEVGCTVDSIIRITAINFVDHQVIAEFNDRYRLRRKTEAEAYKFILEKAAFNSSKGLAADTLKYWQKK